MMNRLLKKTVGIIASVAMVLSFTPCSTAYADTITEQALTDNNVTKIKNDGIYHISGNYTNAAIEVAKDITVELIFDDLTIDATSFDLMDGEDPRDAIITCKKNSNVTISLCGTNNIIGSGSNTYYENAIKHAGDDTAETGTLTFRNCVSSNGILNISGTPDDAIKYKAGIINFASGSINISDVYGDAIKAKKGDDSDEALGIGGTVNFCGASVTITDCYGDGVQAENVNISAGTLDITTVYENASTQYYGTSKANNITESGSTKTETVTYDTGSHNGIKGGTKAETYSYLTEGTTYSQSASGGITITGGTVNINTLSAGLKANRISSGSYSATGTNVYIIGSPDDGIHSNNTLDISGDANITVNASDDGITAAEKLTISDSATVDIKDAFEGMEGAEIIIGTSGKTDGPTVRINSNDDGINAAHKTVSYVYEDESEEQYTKTSVTTGSNTCTIYSGLVYITIDTASTKTRTLGSTTISFTASGDGIDCNGSLNIDGGTVYVFGQVSGDNSPLDTDSGFTLGSAATVLATGCDSMGETAPSKGSGSYITYGSSGNMGGAPGMQGNTGNMPGMQNNTGNMPGMQNNNNNNNMLANNVSMNNFMAPGDNNTNAGATITAGSEFTVKSGTQTIISEVLPYSASYILFASPSLTAGNTYTATIGSTTASLTAVSAGNKSAASNGTNTSSSGTSTSTGSSTSGTSSSSGTSSTSGSSYSYSGTSSSSGSSYSYSGTSSTTSGTSGSSTSATDESSTGSNSGIVTDLTEATLLKKSKASTLRISTEDSIEKGSEIDTYDTAGASICLKITKMATAAKPGKVTYSLNEAFSDTKTITVPNNVYINGLKYKVTKIAANAFSEDKYVTSVKIGSNVTSIGANAFKDCENLTLLVIGKNVKKIGNNALSGITDNAVIKIKAKNKKTYNTIKKLLKEAGAATTTFIYKKA